MQIIILCSKYCVAKSAYKMSFPVYSVCFVSVEGLFTLEDKEKYDPNQVYMERPHFGSTFGHLLEVRLDLLMYRPINYTLVIENNFGHRIDGNPKDYDGCFGSLYRKESDIGLVYADYPTPEFDKVIHISNNPAGTHCLSSSLSEHEHHWRERHILCIPGSTQAISQVNATCVFVVR